MVTIVKSAGIFGIDGYFVGVECDISTGMHKFDIVGLPDVSVRESVNRIYAAIKNCDLPFPTGRVTVNLSPADVRKEGSLYDLPILIGIIAKSVLPNVNFDNCAFMGEISLNGQVKPVSGILSMLIALEKTDIKDIFVPYDNFVEANLCKSDGLNIYPVKHISEILAHFLENKPIEIPKYDNQLAENPVILDYAHVAGQQNAKRALEIAAAGNHNILLSGSPGSGKSMMAKRLSSILPPMTREEHLEVIRIYSTIGMGDNASRFLSRPFRSPHHTVSIQSLAGGSGAGKLPKPGEISLSHNGVLFLDEFPEFQKPALEILRQPIEDGEVTISRVSGKITYPSKFMLVCAMNPCRCGWYGHENSRCTCSEEAIKRYRSRISGPILDRIDLCVDVQAVKYEEMAKREEQEYSLDIRSRVIEARERQLHRFKDLDISANAYISPANMQSFCKLTLDAENFLENAFNSLGLTARSYDRVLRVARTIADLNKQDIINVNHIAEAVSYRGKI